MPAAIPTVGDAAASAARIPVRRLIVAAVLAALPSLAPAPALAGLSDEADINQSLIEVGIARVIQLKCKSIDARMITALFRINSIRSVARTKGYTGAEIDAFINSDDDQERVKEAVIAYLLENGVVEDEPETFCTLGRDEIARKSEIGTLLKSRN